MAAGLGLLDGGNTSPASDAAAGVHRDDEPSGRVRHRRDVEPTVARSSLLAFATMDALRAVARCFHADRYGGGIGHHPSCVHNKPRSRPRSLWRVQTLRHRLVRDGGPRCLIGVDSQSVHPVPQRAGVALMGLRRCDHHHVYPGRFGN